MTNIISIKSSSLYNDRIKNKRKDEQVEYLRQLVGSELFNRAYGMSYDVALEALKLIELDVLEHKANNL